MFIAYFGHDDALAVQRPDIVRWKNHLVELGNATVDCTGFASLAHPSSSAVRLTPPAVGSAFGDRHRGMRFTVSSGP